METNNKLREALSDACYAMFNFLKAQNGGYEEMANALDKAKAALAAPPRNCDRFASAEEAAEAWHKHEANDTGEEYCAECPFNLGEDCARGSVCTIGWLYAETQEGAAK